MQGGRKPINLSFVVAIIFALTTLAALGAFIWAFMEKDYFQNETEIIVNEAVKAAKDEQYQADKDIFAEEAKQPYTKFAGPSDFGSISFEYPKTWAAYNDKNDNSNYSVYFYPSVVPMIKADTAYALRVSVTNKSYEDTVRSYDSQVSKNELTATPISTTVDNYKGIRLDGQISKTLSGSLVIFKVRDKTLTIQVDSQNYMNDFNNTILKSLTFVP